MSDLRDFFQVDCDKIDAKCVNAYIEASLDENKPTDFMLSTSWGDSIIDLTPAIKAGETLTTMYLSPVGDPSCLVYEPERGDNICITGDALSRIISMTKLRDVDQSTTPLNGDVYMYNSTTNLFSPYDLQGFINTTTNNIAGLQSRMSAAEASISSLSSRMATAEGDIANLKSRMSAAETNITNLQTAVSALQTTVSNHASRIAAIEAILAKPAGAPSGATLTWGNINLYSDPNAAISSSGTVTSLDKTHGLYTHNLNSTAYGDEIFG